MGIYLNPGEGSFRESLRSAIYVDKSGLLRYTNSVLSTKQKYVCVSRPRRFGKSMTAEMVAAYYDRTVDAEKLFAGLEISRREDFSLHCSRYDTLRLNMQDFWGKTVNVAVMLERLQKNILRELLKAYPSNDYFDSTNLSDTMGEIYAATGIGFVVVIDEWDCIFRECPHDRAAHDIYLEFLRNWLKDKEYIALAYMTGILPIKKYGTHSALNMFTEFSMEHPRQLARYVGFTETEVRALCSRYRMDFEECKAWYDGYFFDNVGAVYNPRSVVEAMESGEYDTYWNRTETYEALKLYIELNFDGLRDAVMEILAGGRRRIYTGTFQNDMTTFHSADDVLSLLVHLGYLGYDRDSGKVFLPNREIAMEYVSATRTGEEWEQVAKSIAASEELLLATWAKSEEKVALGIERAHFETSHIQYNDENALSYTISLAYYSARRFYNIHREMSTGKGFADMVFIPRPAHSDKPAIIVELKWDKTARAAIYQIKERNYPRSLLGYSEKILLVGISYDRKSKRHICMIEETVNL